MPSSEPFKWRHFQPEIILLNVRWYLRYSLSYRDLEEMMRERGLKVDHTTIYRWVQAYSPEVEKRCRPYLRPTNDSWKVDETYIKIKGVWKYLYRAVDAEGNTLDFMLSAQRDAKAAKRFLKKALNAPHTVEPRVITIDKNAAYPPANCQVSACAIDELKKDEALPKTTETRQSKYLNNTVEQSEIDRVILSSKAFYNRASILVLVELVSGFIFTDVECENRRYETWMDQIAS